MKIGLYFGSFNPIHTGHLIIASQILNANEVDKVWFILSPQNPLKKSVTLLNEYDRLHLLQKAIEKDERLKASDIEFSLPRPSYTAHSLAYLSEKYPKYQFSIIMGSDSYQNINKWKNADFIKNNYQILIYNRPGFDIKPSNNLNIKILDAPLLEISATQVRTLLNNGKSIRYLVPDIVLEEIEKSGFYKKRYSI